MTAEILVRFQAVVSLGWLIMDRAGADEIFRAQASNASSLTAARIKLKRLLNEYLRLDQNDDLKLQTGFYALLFSAWAEADFYKLIFTPGGLDVAEIESVKSAMRKSIEQGWLCCLDIALPKVYGKNNESFLPNARQKLARLIQENVVGPYILRNKFAHGQWVVATTADYSKIHVEITDRLQAIDFVQVDRWFETHGKISHLIEMLIVSPQTGFSEGYWTIVTDIEDGIKKMSKWSLEERKAKLKPKPAD